MDFDDGCGCILYLLLGAVVLFVAAIVLYIVFIAASILGMVAVAAGTVWGGGTAVKNYGLSFKENMIDSNR